MMGVDGVDEIDAGLFRGERGEERPVRGAGFPEGPGIGRFRAWKDSRAQQHYGRKPGGGWKGAEAREHGGDVKR